VAEQSFLQKGIRHLIRMMIRNEPNGELNRVTTGIEVFVDRNYEIDSVNGVWVNK
jgi:acetolactate synthase small subunit